MKVQFEGDEVRALLDAIVDRLLDEPSFAGDDRTALRRWRSEALRRAEGIQELAAKVNADLERLIQTKSKSALVRPDWR